MGAKKRRSAQRFAENIQKSGLTIYDLVVIGDPKLWIPTVELEAILNTKLRGISLAGLPLRTRSKVVKEPCLPIVGLPGAEQLSKDAAAISGTAFRHLRAEVQQPSSLERGTRSDASLRSDSRRAGRCDHARQSGERRSAGAPRYNGHADSEVSSQVHPWLGGYRVDRL